MRDAKSIHLPGQNALLAALPPGDYDRLRADMRQVSLGAGSLLHGSRQRIRWVYFPLSGLISVAVPVGGDHMVEVGLVGNEGMAGLPISLGGDRTTLIERVRVPGTALRLPAPLLSPENQPNPALTAIVRRYTQAFMVMLAQGVACSLSHCIEQRCARWLLMLDDRLGPGEFPLTHQALAQMLSVRRASVSEVAEKFGRRGLIHYSRGLMWVGSRAGLEKLSCDCYRIIRREYDRLLLARAHVL